MTPPSFETHAKRAPQDEGFWEYCTSLTTIIASHVSTKRPRFPGAFRYSEPCIAYSRLPVSDRMNWNMLMKFR